MPNSATSFEKINALLAQVDIILTEEKSLPAIESDIVKERLRNLYARLLAPATPLPAAEYDEGKAEPVSDSPMPRFVAEEAEPVAPVAPVAALPEDKTEEEPTADEAATVEEVAAEEPVAEEPKVAEESTAAQEPAAEEDASIEAQAQASEPVAQESAAEETSSLFAPPEEEAQPSETLPPMMDNIEQNPFGSLFDFDDETAPTAETEAPKAEPVAEPAPEVAKPKEKAASEQSSLRSLLRKPADAAHKTLGEQLGGASVVADQLAVRANRSKVADLRTIININDKFSFMSELFHGNMKAYNDFILRLNAISDKQEALEHVRMIAQENQWDKESATVQTFYSIFERKF